MLRFFVLKYVVSVRDQNANILLKYLSLRQKKKKKIVVDFTIILIEESIKRNACNVCSIRLRV